MRTGFGRPRPTGTSKRSGARAPKRQQRLVVRGSGTRCTATGNPLRPHLCASARSDDERGSAGGPTLRRRTASQGIRKHWRASRSKWMAFGPCARNRRPNGPSGPAGRSTTSLRVATDRPRQAGSRTEITTHPPQRTRHWMWRPGQSSGTGTPPGEGAGRVGETPAARCWAIAGKWWSGQRYSPTNRFAGEKGFGPVSARSPRPARRPRALVRGRRELRQAARGRTTTRRNGGGRPTRGEAQGSIGRQSGGNARQSQRILRRTKTLRSSKPRSQPRQHPVRGGRRRGRPNGTRRREGIDRGDPGSTVGYRSTQRGSPGSPGMHRRAGRDRRERLTRHSYRGRESSEG